MNISLNIWNVAMKILTFESWWMMGMMESSAVLNINLLLEI